MGTQMTNEEIDAEIARLRALRSVTVERGPKWLVVDRDGDQYGPLAGSMEDASRTRDLAYKDADFDYAPYAIYRCEEVK